VPLCPSDHPGRGPIDARRPRPLRAGSPRGARGGGPAARARGASRPASAGASAWLIGSLAWGGFGERSDVDLVFRGVAPAEALALEAALAVTAEAPIDLLVFEALPPSFQARVLAEGIHVVDA
jgi:predicted nucleotidyltransferase